MVTSNLPPQAIAMDLATGNWKAQATRSFVSTGIAAAMEQKCTEGAYASYSDIAVAAGTHPSATYRLLRFLSTLDICVEGDDKTFTLGKVGEVLTPNHPQSVANLVEWEASLTSALVWDKMDDFLKTNKPQSTAALGEGGFWAHLHQNPSVLNTFQRAMTGYSNEESFFLVSPELSPTFDLSAYKTICDFGSAEGSLALALAKRFADANWILADLPEAIDRIDKSSLPSNFSTKGFDFLKDDAPVADAYILKHIIHDWADEESVTILNGIQKANADASVFIIEFGPMPAPNVPHLAKGFDLHMGVILDACERTQEEYDALFGKSGYKRVATHMLAGGNYPLYVQELKADS